MLPSTDYLDRTTRSKTKPPIPIAARTMPRCTNSPLVPELKKAAKAANAAKIAAKYSKVYDEDELPKKARKRNDNRPSLSISDQVENALKHYFPKLRAITMGPNTYGFKFVVF